MDVFAVIGNLISPAIGILGAGVLLGLIYVFRELSQLKTDLEDRVQGTKGKYYRDQKTLELKQRDAAIAKREDTYSLRKKFDDIYSKYLIASQIIPVFPLLGILGTVSGLISQVNAGDMDAIRAALGTALYTTFYGLIAVIILKLVEAFLVIPKINEIESIFNDYDIKYRDAEGIMHDNIGEE